jgi:hypothetical protein
MSGGLRLILTWNPESRVVIPINFAIESLRNAVFQLVQT